MSLRLTTLLLLAGVSAHAAHVEFNLADFALAGTLTNRSLFLTPKSTPRVSGTNIITSDRREYNTGTNQSVTVSNVVFGNYDVEVRGPYKATTFTILVPDTNATLNVTGLVVSVVSVPASTVGYTQTAADARFVATTNGTAQRVRLNNGVLMARFATNANAAVSTNYSVFAYNGTTNAVFTLPTAASASSHHLAVKIEVDNTDTNLTVNAASGDRIDFATSQTLSNKQSLRLYSDGGTNWFKL